MKALLFVTLAHFVLSDHHMEAENRRLRDANRALQQALQAMTSQESAVGFDWGKAGYHGQKGSDYDEFELADSSESSSFDAEEEVGRRRRRRRRRRRPARPAPEPKKLFTLKKADHECNDNTHEKYLGTFQTVEECANACKERSVCKTFIYGKDYKKGWCYDEGVADDTHCGEWQSDKYDFYDLNRAEADDEFAVAGHPHHHHHHPHSRRYGPGRRHSESAIANDDSSEDFSEYEVGYAHHHEDGVGRPPRGRLL